MSHTPAVAVVLVALLLLAGCVLRAPTPAPRLYREAVATFEDPVKPFQTDLSGSIGPLGAGSKTSLVHRPEAGATPGCLEVAWSLAGGPEAEECAGMWLSLRGPLQSSHVVLDLSPWERLSFKVRGRAVPVEEPQREGAACALRVEVTDERRRREHAAFRYLAVEPAATWSTVSLSADIADPGSWRFTSGPLDPRRAKELRFVVERRFNRPEGHLLLDDIELVRRARPGDEPPRDDDEFLAQVARATFRFFWGYAHPTLGFAPDRSTWHDLYQTAAIGFELSALCVGAERGYVSREEAADRVRLILSSLLKLPQGPRPAGVGGYRGFFYHFLDERGLRKGRSELSSIDSALLLCGVLTCRGYFGRADEADIRRMAKELFDRTDWRWMLRDDGLFSHGWKPELPGGFLRAGWDCYTDETYLICLLALAGNSGRPPERQVPADVFWRWHRVKVEAPSGAEFVASCPGSMYCHIFASLWLPPEVLDRPDRHPTQPVNWWENTRKYVRSNYAYCRSHPELYGKAGWGLTACEGRVGHHTIYRAYGAPPVFGVRGPGRFFQLDVPQPSRWRFPGEKRARLVRDNSVLAVYGAASGINFLPRQAIAALRWYRREADLWRSAECGFGDAFAPSTGYTNHAVFAIDAGPMLIAIDNYRARLRGEQSAVWRGFMANPEVRRALEAVYGAAVPDRR